MARKKSIRERFREWDADAFDLTEQISGPMHPAPQTPDPVIPEPDTHVTWIEERQTRAFARIYPVLAAVLGAVMIAFLLRTVLALPAFGAAGTPTDNEVVERYVRDGLSETGAVNIVAGVILDYRAFDTLGESHVLFTALTAVLILLLGQPNDETDETGTLTMQHDRVVTMTASILVPIIILFGVYVILNGHLGPGGGFSGGAIIGAGLILYAIAFGFGRIEAFLNLRSFRGICLAALWFYSLSKCYSFFCGANGLHTIFSPGEAGRILSAGLILPLNVAVGIVVACTMYGLFSVFQRGKI